MQQTRNRGRGVRSMNRRQDQVAGDRGGHGNLSRLSVPDFTNHDHVGILPQDGSERCGKVEPCTPIDVNLACPIESVFDRVLDGDDVLLFAVDLRQGRKQCGAFPRTRRACREHDPLPTLQQSTESPEVGIAHAKSVEIRGGCGLVEQADHCLFAARCGKSVHAQGEWAISVHEGDPTVLSPPSDRYIHSAHHLEA